MYKVIANPSNIFSVVKIVFLAASFLAITLLIFPANAQNGAYKISTVVIDAGHGGHDPGTHGKKLKEKDLTLKIALKVGGYIEQLLPDVKVIYTRKTDVFIPLDERAEIANKNNADVFISIHVNASPNPSVYGTETWTMGVDKSSRNLEVAKRENAVILLDENYQERYEGFDPNKPESIILFELMASASATSSLDLAAKVEEQFKTRVGRRSLGVKQGPFWVLWKTTMPSVLIEVGYLSNEKEERDLGDPTIQDYIASGIFRAFRAYKNEVEDISLRPPAIKVE